MIFEIALRVRQINVSNHSETASAESFEKWMSYGQYLTIFIAAGIALCTLILDIFGLKQWLEHAKTVYTNPVFAFFYLFMFLLMGAVNIFLVCVMR